MPFKFYNQLHYSTKKAMQVLVCHLMVLFSVYLVLQNFGFISIFPNDNNLLGWDASWYLSIKNFGYKFIPEKPCNLAFFPLFPFFWRLIDVSPIVISIFNLLVFFSSFFMLIKNEKLPSILFLLILSIPSYIFFGLPYSESFFFLFSTLILRGYSKNSNRLKLFGFLGASLTRSVSLIFIPIVIISELLDRNDVRSFKQKLLSILISVSGCLIGLFTTVIIQWVQTGKWSYLLEVQQFWRRGWILPRFPLTTYDPERILGIETISFAIGMIAVFLCITWCFNFILKREDKSTMIIKVNKSVVFSMLFVCATVVLDTFFTFNEDSSTNIWSMNRHILCTPFAVVFLIWVFKTISDSLLNLVGIPCLIILCAFLTGLGKYPNLLVYYGIFFLPFFLLKFFPQSKNTLYIFYTINLVLQMYFLQDFLDGRWIA